MMTHQCDTSHSVTPKKKDITQNKPMHEVQACNQFGAIPTTCAVEKVASGDCIQTHWRSADSHAMLQRQQHIIKRRTRVQS